MKRKPSKKVIAALVKKISEKYADDEGALDEQVHEIKSGEAADINNGGFQAQVEFLLAAYGNDVKQLEKEVLDV